MLDGILLRKGDSEVTARSCTHARELEFCNLKKIIPKDNFDKFLPKTGKECNNMPICVKKVIQEYNGISQLSGL